MADQSKKSNDASNDAHATIVETLASPEEGVRKRGTKNAETGYSWVILLVAFLLNLVMNATSGGMGVIMVELMYHFNVQRSVIFWIGGIMVSVGYLSSFLIGWLIKEFGCRWTGCAASIVASASLICASFAESVAALYVFYGFILGLSVTFYWNIASIIVQQYFDKRRALAQGMLMSGMSGGLFIWPPITRLMMDIYGWRGAMLLHAGIQLHGMVLCSLIRPLPPATKKNDIYRPIYHSPTGAEQKGENKDEVNQRNCDSFVERTVQDGTGKNGGVESEGVKNGVEGEVILMEECKRDESQCPPMLPQQGGEDHDAQHEAHSCGGAARCFHALFKILIVFPHYLLYMLAVAMVQTGNIMPYTLTPARADALGIDKHLGALLVTVAAGVSGVCRVLCGLVADHPAINQLVLSGVAGLIGGVLTALSTLLTTFTTLVIAFGIIGVPSAVFMATFGTAAVDIVGKKYVQQGVGLMSVAFGIAQLSTFLGTGWLNDLMGDPKYGFLVFGIVEAIGGFVFLGTYIVDKRFKRNFMTTTEPSALTT